MVVIEKQQKNNNRIILSLTLIFALVAIYVGVVGLLVITHRDFVVDGEMDLTAIENYSNQSFPLKGTLEFYWEQLLEPKDFSENLETSKVYMKVPGSWADKKQEYVYKSDHGIATYRMFIIPPNKLENPAIKINRVTRAMKIYINGEYVHEVGKVSESLELYEPGYEAKIIDINSTSNNKNSIEIIVQVANWDYTRGGIQESFLFGSREALEMDERMNIGIQLILVGGIFAFALYYLSMFIAQKNNYSAIIFCLLCFNLVPRALIWGEAPVSYIFPSATLEASIWINYLTGYLIIPLLTSFIIYFFNDIKGVKSLWYILIPSWIFFVMLFIPAEQRAATNNYYYAIIIFQICILLYFQLGLVRRGIEFAVQMFIAIGIMFLGIIVDVLYYSGWSNYHVTYATVIGNFFMILVLADIQSRRQISIQKQLIMINEQLREIDALREKIAITENAFLYAQIKPHFIYNTLNSIASLAYVDGEKAAELIGYFSTYLRNSIDNENLNSIVHLSKEIGLVRAYINIEMARFENRILYEEDIDWTVDFMLPPIVIQPLVENAIKHCMNNFTSKIHISLTIKRQDSQYLIIVKDNGLGIDEKTIKGLLDGTSSKSIALVNINNRLLKRYGSGLEIESSEGNGTRVIIRIKDVENK